MRSGGSRTKAEYTKPRVRQNDHSQEERIKAVAAALTANPDRPTGVIALDAANATLTNKITTTTLYRWLQQYGDEVRATLPVKTRTDIILEGRQAIVDQWAAVRQKALERMLTDEAIQNARYGELNAAAGTAHDKLEKMSSMSPDIVMAIDRLSAAVELHGHDLRMVLEDIATLYEQTAPRLKDVIADAREQGLIESTGQDSPQKLIT